jgi:hypothetical protein
MHTECILLWGNPLVCRHIDSPTERENARGAYSSVGRATDF